MSDVYRLCDLYDADMAARDPNVKSLREVPCPHPLHGVDYADGAIICGRATCRPCRDYLGLPVVNRGGAA